MQALGELVSRKAIQFSSADADREILKAYAALCESDDDYLHLQAYKSLLDAGMPLANLLYNGLCTSLDEDEKEFRALAEAVDAAKQKAQLLKISCPTCVYFIRSFLQVFSQMEEGLPLGELFPQEPDPSQEQSLSAEIMQPQEEFTVEDGVLLRYAGSAERVVLPAGLREIGEEAFSGNTSVRFVEMPGSVARIGASAFRGCTSLESVTLSPAVIDLPQSTFEGCVRLKRIDLSAVRSAGSRCFRDCVLLRTVSPSALVRVGSECFSFCKSLSDFAFLARLKRVGDRAFCDCNLREADLSSCEHLGEDAFAGCDDLVSLKTGVLRAHEFDGWKDLRFVESSSDMVPPFAFRGCENLQSVRFTVPVSEIGESAFEGCSSLSSAQMRFLGKELPRRAFYGCGQLSFDFLGEVCSFGEQALAHTDLTDFSFDRPFVFLGASAFADSVFPQGVKLDLRGCRAERGAFRGLRSVDRIDADGMSDGGGLPLFALFSETEEAFSEECSVGVLSVGGGLAEGMFAHRTNICAIECACTDGVIPSSAFAGCGAERIEVRGRVTDIDPKAFVGCDRLRELSLDVSVLETPALPCKGLEVLRLGASLTRFSAAALSACPRVRAHIEGACPRYASRDGSVFSENGKCLNYLAGGALELLDGVCDVAPYAVRPSKEELVLPAHLHLMPRAVDCGGVKRIYVERGCKLEPCALFRVGSLELLSLAEAAEGSFSTALDGITIERVELNGAAISSISSLFNERVALFVSELKLTGEEYDRAAVAGMGRLRSLEIDACDLSHGMLEGIRADRLVFGKVGTIAKGTFTALGFSSVEIGSAAHIESGAFTGTQVARFTFGEGGGYRLDAGILYGTRELVYCFEKGLTDCEIPAFVKRVCAGAFDRLPELRSLTVRHADITFEGGAVRECPKLTQLALAGCGNECVSEIFENRGFHLREIAFSGREIKPKLFSGLRNLARFRAEVAARIGEEAFLDDVSLAEISLMGAEEIGERAFAGCKSLAEISLGKKLRRLGVGWAEGAPVRTLMVDAENPRFFSSQNCLIERAGRALVYVSPAGGRELTFGREIGVIRRGAMTDCGAEKLTLDGVGKIEAGAFVRCGALRDLTLLSVKTERGIFEGACGLEKITTDGVDADGSTAIATLFEGGMSETVRHVTLTGALHSGDLCGLKRVEEVVLPPTAAIPDRFFENCTSLRAIDLPAACKVVGAGAFRGCTSLSEVRAADGVTRIGEEAFLGCVSLAALRFGGAEEIGSRAFGGCTSLKELEIGPHAVRLGEDLAKGAPVETLVTPLPDHRALSAFGIAEGSLRRLEIEGGTIGEDTFSGQTSLREVILPASVTDIPCGAFCGFKELVYINLENVRTVGDRAFEGTSLKEIDLGRAEQIGERAFAATGEVAHLELPLLRGLGKEAFAGAKVRKVVLGDGLTRLPERAFADAWLTAAVLPAGLESIGDGAFAGTRMKDYELAFPETVVTVGKKIFENADSPVVIIHKGQSALPGWDPSWDDGCRGYGLLWRRRRVKVVEKGV